MKSLFKSLTLVWVVLVTIPLLIACTEKESLSDSTINNLAKPLLIENQNPCTVKGVKGVYDLDHIDDLYFRCLEPKNSVCYIWVFCDKEVSKVNNATAIFSGADPDTDTDTTLTDGFRNFIVLNDDMTSPTIHYNSLAITSDSVEYIVTTQ